MSEPIIVGGVVLADLCDNCQGACDILTTV